MHKACPFKVEARYIVPLRNCSRHKLDSTKMNILSKIILASCILLSRMPAMAQEYIYPNKLFSDQGLIEYRPYTLEEARAIEQGDNSTPSDNPFLLDWGPERRIAEVPDPFVPKLAKAGDSIYCTFTTIGPIQPYFIKSSDAGTSWSQCLYLGDTSVVQLCLFPEIVKNGDSLVVGFKGQEAPYGENLFWRSSTDRGDSWSSLHQVFPYWINSFSLYSSLTNYRRTLYFSYIEYVHDSLYVLKSTNWGTSWNGRGRNVAYLNGTPQPMIIRAAGNNVHLVWVNEEGTINVRYSRSTDGGLNWTPQLDIATDSSGAQLCHVAVQDSHVVVSWMGYKYSPYMFTGDLFIRQSFDNGATWDSAQVLTNLHYVSTSSTYIEDSIIVAVWQDFRFGNNNDEVMGRISTDYGQSWTDEVRLSYGDYHSHTPIATITGSVVHIIWGDQRSDYPGLYYRADYLLSDAVSEGPVVPKASAMLSVYPNPFNSSVTIGYSDNSSFTSELFIYNLLGEQIRTLRIEVKEGKAICDGKDEKGRPISSGVYFAKISASGKDNSVKLVLLK
jgi:hypothetical protein